MNGSAFEFTGRVESINIKGAGPNSNQCLFSLISPGGKQHWSFLLDPVSEPARYGAMVSLLAAAWSADKIVSLNTAPNSGGPAYAAEIEVVRSKK